MAFHKVGAEDGNFELAIGPAQEDLPLDRFSEGVEGMLACNTLVMELIEAWFEATTHP